MLFYCRKKISKYIAEVAQEFTRIKMNLTKREIKMSIKKIEVTFECDECGDDIVIELDAAIPVSVSCLVTHCEMFVLKKKDKHICEQCY